MEQKKVAVIINAHSGVADLQNNVAEIRGAFASFNIVPEIALVHFGEDITRKTKDAISGGAMVIVAAGGDGTISGVVGAIMGTSAVLGVIPMGTFNHFAIDLKMVILKFILLSSQ